MSGRLSNKVAVVTGGGAGIGAAIAALFAREGAQVVVAEVNRAAGEKTAAAIGGTAIPVDVTDEASVAALFAAVEKQVGRLDVLVNNAGIGPLRATAEEMDMKTWDSVIAVNVRGVILCTKHAIPLLKRSKGAIVNMASVAGFKGSPGHSSYAASKFAVRGITESVAQEVGPLGIRVNSVCPGAVRTDALIGRIRIRAESEGKDFEELVKTAYTGPTALGRWIEPEDVAYACLFLASDAASVVTGEHVRVDAGRR